MAPRRTTSRKTPVRKTSTTRTIKPKAGSGEKPVTFKKGGLHDSLGVPAGKPIPAAKMQGALDGDYGARAKKQALFAVNVLGDKAPGTGAAAKPARAARKCPRCGASPCKCRGKCPKCGAAPCRCKK